VPGKDAQEQRYRFVPGSRTCDAQRVTVWHHDHVSARRHGIGLGNTTSTCAAPQALVLAPRSSNLQRSGNDLCTTRNYLRSAAGIGLGTTIKYLRRIMSAAANSSLGTTIKYLVNQNAGAGENWAKAHIHKAGHEFR
jgi:hypothetical protein